MKIIVVNEGVQPELIQISMELLNQNIDLKYLTRSSLAKDSWFLPLAIRITGLVRISHILKKRIIDLTSINLVVYYRLSSFLIRFLPRMLSSIANAFISKRFYRKANEFISSHPADYLILSEGRNGLQIPANSGIKTILILSTTTKRHQNQMRRNDMVKSPNWTQFYSPGLFTDQEIAEQEQDFLLCDFIISPSQYVKNSLPELFKDKTHVAHLGFDSTLFRFSNLRKARLRTSDPLRCIYVGQFTQRKGVGYLLEAFRKSRLPDGSSLQFVGLMPTGRRKLLESQFPGVHFSRPLSRTQIKELLDQCDLFVLPSIVEGFALSAIEALASGIPVLITHNTLDSQIEHLKNGLIAETGDSQSLLELLQFAALNPKIMEEIGVNGSALAMNFTWEEYRKKIRGIFQAEIL